MIFSGGLAAAVQQIGIKRILYALLFIVLLVVGYFLYKDIKGAFQDAVKFENIAQQERANAEFSTERLEELSEEIFELEEKSKELRDEIKQSEEKIEDLEVRKAREEERIRNLQAADSSCDAAFDLLVDEAKTLRNKQ